MWLCWQGYRRGVNRYLNHGYISLEKQEKVRRAIDETGFKSNFFAKRLKTKESKLIGIVLPRMDSVTVGKTITGISRILDPAGYQILVGQPALWAEGIGEYSQLAAAGR